MLHALETVRSGMPSARHAVYLNAGTWGPLPTRAADAMRARVDSVEASGRIGTSGYEQFQAIREGARAAFAEAIASEPARIALTHSTSGGMNLVLGGLAFAAGDEVITTDNEHAGLLEPLAALQRRYGIEVRVAEVLHGADAARCRRVADRPAHEARGALARALGERPRPAAAGDLGGRARGRRAGARGRRAGRGRDRRRPRGARRRRVRGPGQKWLCGPNGAGFLWVADGFEDRFEVAAPSYYTRDFRSEGAPFWPGARRHDGASLSSGALAGLSAAVAFRRELVGWSEGAVQMAERAGALRRAALGRCRA